MQVALRYLAWSFGALIAATALALALAGSQAVARDVLVFVLAGVIAIGGTLLLAVDKRALFFIIIAMRASCDPLFDSIRTDSTTATIGVGAALNALVILIGCMYALQRPLVIKRHVLLMWSGFLLAAAISTAIAPERGAAVRLLLVQVSYCAVFGIAFYLVRTDNDVRTCLLAILCSSVVPVAVGLANLAAGASAIADDEFRVRSTFNHPNIFAFYLVLVMAVILYLHKRRAAPLAPAVRLSLWLYTGALLVLLVATKTRSAWLACVLIFACYGFFFQRRFLLYALCVPLLLLFDAGVRERLLDLTTNHEISGNTDLNSYAWRLVLWRSGLEWMDRSHSIFGYGLDSFKFYSPRFFPLEGRDTWDPHNVYIQLFFEAGLVGLLSYLFLFSRLLVQIRRGLSFDFPGTIIAMATVAAYLVVAYADNMLYYLSYNWYFWFFTGIVCAAATLQRPPAPTA
jgi:putative inorganic carbon (HCO3(-)) transporter